MIGCVHVLPHMHVWLNGVMALKKYIKELINFIFKCTQFVESTQNRGSADGEERQKLL